jgi:hypothetical protein
MTRVASDAFATPPIKPPLRPLSTAAGSLPCSSGQGSRSDFWPVAMSIVYLASSLGSLGRLGSVRFIRRLGPGFRIGRDPPISLFLGRKIPDARDGAISSTYGNGPTTVLDHFRVKFWVLAHDKNTRLQQEGSLANRYWPVSDSSGLIQNL